MSNEGKETTRQLITRLLLSGKKTKRDICNELQICKISLDNYLSDLDHAGKLNKEFSGNGLQKVYWIKSEESLTSQ